MIPDTMINEYNTRQTTLIYLFDDSQPMMSEAAQATMKEAITKAPISVKDTIIIPL